LLHLALALAAFANPFTDLINMLGAGFNSVLQWINLNLTHNYGWSMIVLALVVNILLIPLTIQRLRNMQEMQALQPYLKRIQTKYKNDKQKLGEETMKLYREHGVNMFGGCLPTLLQFPVLFGVYNTITLNTDHFQHAGWLWIGTAISHQFPLILATNLYAGDKVLLGLYAISMYFSIKLTSNASMMDEQQAQMINTQAMLMPVMLFVMGGIYQWHSAFILYWLSFNVLSVAQTVLFMRVNPSRIPKPVEETDAMKLGFPHDCAACNETLVLAKGNKCSKCGVKARKQLPQATA
jgi:YidC/Oxa1 family membrane protein insertase